MQNNCYYLVMIKLNSLSMMRNCLQLENYGLAIQDSESAMAMDPQYLKAYYRRASALLALGKHKEVRENLHLIALVYSY